MLQFGGGNRSNPRLLTSNKNLKERGTYLLYEYDLYSHGIAITEGNLDQK